MLTNRVYPFVLIIYASTLDHNRNPCRSDTIAARQIFLKFEELPYQNVDGNKYGANLT